MPFDPKITRVIVVNPQFDFTNPFGVLHCENASEAVSNIIGIMDHALAANVHINTIMDTHQPNYVTEQEFAYLKKEHCIKLSQGWTIQEELIPYVLKTKIIEQNRSCTPDVIDCFYEKGYKHENIIICGFSTEMNVLSIALTLNSMCPDKNIFVPPSSTAGSTEQYKESALDIMSLNGINTTTDWLEHFVS